MGKQEADFEGRGSRQLPRKMGLALWKGGGRAGRWCADCLALTAIPQTKNGKKTGSRNPASVPGRSLGRTAPWSPRGRDPGLGPGGAFTLEIPQAFRRTIRLGFGLERSTGVIQDVEPRFRSHVEPSDGERSSHVRRSAGGDPRPEAVENRASGGGSPRCWGTAEFQHLTAR